MGVTKEKDTLFRFMFSDKENAMALFNALVEDKYLCTSVEDIYVTTLQDSVYINLKNDVSILVHNWLVLYEQQSTWNPNMPLRGLMYYSSIMERLLKDKNYYPGNTGNIYKSTIVKIPAPDYYVIYNGRKPIKESVLRLSDAFINPSSGYEWTANIIDINNDGRVGNLAICTPIQEYSGIVHSIEIKKMLGYTTETAIKESVMECSDDSWIGKHRQEVVSIMSYELKEEEVRELFKEEGEDRMAKLTKILLREQKHQELDRATEDAEYRKKLFAEYNI